ncbi:hypothetical protein DVH24_016199 [Malus domestica]|uniref:Beta-glucosidase n=1 Tax=Malus domestica TaxID=3750 RepID=A0A498JKH7_MALDO|nr:hypothetical protein DVH24_016199 [Malus domestica]
MLEVLAREIIAPCLSRLPSRIVPGLDTIINIFNIFRKPSSQYKGFTDMVEGVKVKGYFAWALLDVYEWDSGYNVRFGLTYIDYKHKMKRYLKYSAYWFKMFLLK